MSACPATTSGNASNSSPPNPSALNPIPSLATTDTKLDAFAGLAKQTRIKIHARLGREAGDAYIKRSANWLPQVKKGAIIEFADNGTSTQQLALPSKPSP